MGPSLLSQIDLEQFKCFQLLKLPLGALTLLTGWNASGKSSVLQALVLLHQTIREKEWSRRLLLNGTELSLGTVADVVDKVTGRRTFGIGLVDGAREIRWSFDGEDRRNMSALVTSLRVGGEDISPPEVLRYLLPPGIAAEDAAIVERLRRLSYLTAERISPQDVYPLEDPNSTQVVGPKGEFAVSLLYWNRDELVLDGLAIGDNPPTLLHQVEARMDEFFPGCSLEIQHIPQANVATLGLRTSPATDFHRPVHVGFGLTQVLPIIVAALSRKREDLLLIENPEVHLHPAGQAKMGWFLSQVASAGVQVMIETHSDHVLNGIRRSAKDRVISADRVHIHFFKDRNQEGEQVVSPIVDPAGNVDAWPSGFFDQFDKDLNYFAGWGE
jgi:predicted ATPase